MVHSNTIKAELDEVDKMDENPDYVHGSIKDEDVSMGQISASYPEETHARYLEHGEMHAGVHNGAPEIHATPQSTVPGPATPVQPRIGPAQDEQLQNHLIRQQLLVGIAPENVVYMPHGGYEDTEQAPAILQITNNGITAPVIPPATFNSHTPQASLSGVNAEHTNVASPVGAANRSQSGSISGASHELLDGISRNGDQTLIYSAASVDPTLASYTINPHSVQGHAEINEPSGHIIGDATTTAIPEETSEDSHPSLSDSIETPVEPHPLNFVMPPHRQITTRTQKREVAANATALYNEGVDFFRAMIEDPILTGTFIQYLDIEDIVKIYSISKAFHYFVKSNLCVIIRNLVKARAPLAAHAFPWRCYPSLLFLRHAADEEIIQRAPGPDQTLVVSTPSFPWLQMVCARDRVVDEIMQTLASSLIVVPRECKQSILKIWFLMNLPDTGRRLWTIQNNNLWTDLDLFYAIIFISCVDTYVKRSLGNRVCNNLALIMRQPSLLYLRDVLLGRRLGTHIGMLRDYIATRFEFNPNDRRERVLGMPIGYLGMLQYEYYGVFYDHRERLISPDQLILREATRRGLNLRMMYNDVFLYDDAQRHASCAVPNRSWDLEVHTQLPGYSLYEMWRLDEVHGALW